MISAAITDRMARLRQTPIQERISNMRELLLTAGDEAQQIRHLPAWAAKEMVNQGLYRFTLPPELGGENLLPQEQIGVVEACSAIDGSVGWCVQINSEINSLIIRQMDPSVAQELYEDWGILTCAGVGPGMERARARRENGGWRLWSQGAFGSGCHNATMAMVHRLSVGVPQEDGTSSGKAFLIPRGEFEIVDTWNVAGLRGSGSHDVKIDGKFIPEKMTLPADLFAGCPYYENPTYRNPTQVPYNKAAVALGIGKGAVNDFTELAVTKTPWGSGSLLKDQADAAIRLGEMLSTMLSARAWVMETQQEIIDNLGPLSAGKLEPDWEVTRLGLLACTHAAQATRHVVDVIHNTAGTTASRMDHPLERRLRDAHQAASHAAISYRHYGNWGRTFMGHEPPEQYRRKPSNEDVATRT